MPSRAEHSLSFVRCTAWFRFTNFLTTLTDWLDALARCANSPAQPSSRREMPLKRFPRDLFEGCARNDFQQRPQTGVVWGGVLGCGVVWRVVGWGGGVLFCVAWCGVAWRGVGWCGVVSCAVVWCGVVWCGVVCCGVVCCGVLCRLRRWVAGWV